MSKRDIQLSILLARVAQRDVAAFRTLYDTTLPRLMRLSRFLCGTPELAGDALQEAYVKIWGAADQYRSEKGPAMGWMLKIARNCALDRLRRERTGRYQERLFAEQSMHGVQPADSETSIDGYVNHLPPELSKLLIAVYQQGMTHTEVSDTLGIPLGTVKSRIRKALIAVREALP